MKKVKNKKRMVFSLCLLLVMLFASTTIVYAEESSYTYPNGYKMTYNGYTATVLGKSGAAAYTKTDNEAIAFVAIFSYKNGTVKNSATKESAFYCDLAITGNGGNAFMSVHSLKYPNGDPVGTSKKFKY